MTGYWTGLRPCAARRPVRVLGALALLVPVGVWCASHAVSDVGDGIFHYLAAHFAFSHPRLLLDSWCKPLFTLLAAPLASAGFAGMVLFQALVTAGTAAILCRIGGEAGWKSPWLPALLLYVAPGTWTALASGWTEPLFGLLLVLALRSVERGRQRAAFAVVGFLPFVRAEGWVIMAWWAVIGLKERRPGLLVAALAGHVLYAIAGTLFVFHDPLWMFRQNPYWVIDRTYGHGSWMHFFARSPDIAGLPVAIATAAAGLAILSRRAVAARAAVASPTAADDARWCDFQLGSFAAYFFAHVVFWRFGLFKSFGLSRVLIAVLPVAALVVGREVELLGRRLRGAIPAGVPAYALAIVVVCHAFGNHPTALQIATRSDQQRAADAAVAWIRTKYATAAETPLVYSSNPYMAFLLDLDVFDPTRSRFVSELVDSPPVGGALVVWDSWFSVAEHGFSSEKLATLSLEDSQRFRVNGTGGGFYEVVTGRVPFNDGAARQ